MKIDRKIIKGLEPCEDKYNNYLKFYGDRQFTKAQFMGLKNISHEDKLWVVLRLMTKKQCVNVAIEAAESVLHIFEEKYPDDKRPRLLLEAIKGLTLLSFEQIEGIASKMRMCAVQYQLEECRNIGDECLYDSLEYINAAYCIIYSGYVFISSKTEIDRHNFIRNTLCAYKGEAKTIVEQKAIRKLVLKHWKG